jgi:hypothetical protein
MNTDFLEKLRLLLYFCFNEQFEEINFGGKPGPIEIVSYAGKTYSGKTFWGRFKLADQFAVIDWVEISIDGKFHRFTYHPELEEPFVRN